MIDYLGNRLLKKSSNPFSPKGNIKDYYNTEAFTALKPSDIGSHYGSLQLTFLRLFGASAIVRCIQMLLVGIKHNHIVLVYKRKHTNL